MKRVLLLCALTLLISATASARPALVQAKYGEAYPDTKVSVTFDTPVTPGSLIVAGVRPSNGGLATITFGGRTLTKNARSPIMTMFSYEVHSLVNAPGGSTTVTATVTGPAGQERMWIAEFSGVATSAALQGTSSNGGFASGGAILNAGSVTTPTADALIVCAGASDTDNFGGSMGDEVDPTPGAGYTMIDLQEFDDDKTAVSYRVVPSAGTYGCTMRSHTALDWQAIAVVFAPLSSGGSGSAQATPAAPTHLRISR